MKDIKAEYNHHLYSEVQIRFSRIMDMLYWCPGGSEPEPEPEPEPKPRHAGRPNLAKPEFIVSFFGKFYFCPAQDTIFEAPYVEPVYLWYSGGLDTAPNCLLLHQHTWYNDDEGTVGLEVVIFDYEGNRVITAYGLDEGRWPQTVKKIGDKIWFSLTVEEPVGVGGFYSIPWDETLESYPVPVADANLEYQLDYNWEVEERAVDGAVFFGGLDGDSWDPPPPDPHSIYYFDRQNSTVIKVLEVGGYSSGFAFDSEGNLWSGEYLLSFDPEMYILPCRLGMWTKEAVDAVIDGLSSFLVWDDAEVVIELGTRPETELNWGPNDIETDPDGNIYVSLNTYDGWGENNEYGAVIQVYKDGEGYHTKYIFDADYTGNNRWDWHRGLAFDSSSNLLLDVDMNQSDPDPDFDDRLLAVI